MFSVVQANIVASGYRAIREASSRWSSQSPSAHESAERPPAQGLSLSRIYATNAGGTQVRVVMSHEETEGQILDRPALIRFKGEKHKIVYQAGSAPPTD